jgi:hypothetical protein
MINVFNCVKKLLLTTKNHFKKHLTDKRINVRYLKIIYLVESGVKIDIDIVIP